ncbi:hypothetical protein C0073_016175 [Aeromonas veronii]|nr:hypothetical protein C0073_016175 [Aeromonas veronii]
MDRGPIRHDMAGRDGGIGLRIEQGSQSGIIKLGGQGPVRPSVWALLRSFWMEPTLTLVQQLIWRTERSASSRSRSTSRILRIAILLADIGSSRQKEERIKGC